jgi:hypothetical protein
MGWALFWAFIIGSASNSDHTGSSAGFIAFLVIWYFANKSNDIAKVGDNMIRGLKNKISDLESTRNRSYTPPEKDHEIY